MCVWSLPGRLSGGHDVALGLLARDRLAQVRAHEEGNVGRDAEDGAVACDGGAVKRGLDVAGGGHAVGQHGGADALGGALALGQREGADQVELGTVLRTWGMGGEEQGRL